MDIQLNRTIWLTTESDKRKKIVLEESPSAHGFDSDIYKIKSEKELIAKIYHRPFKVLNISAKIAAMIGNPPVRLGGDGKKKSQTLLAWPIGILTDESEQFLGYCMPKFDVEKSTTLNNLLSETSRKAFNLSENYQYRIKITYYLALLISTLHDCGHYAIDLTPEHINIDRESGDVTIMGCDNFSIISAEGKRFPCNKLSTESISPEAIQNNWAPVEFDESQDRFSLAVILFQLFNMDVHPFSGESVDDHPLPESIRERIENHLYAYGNLSNNHINPSRYSLHDTFDLETRQLFDLAFEEEGQRPSARAWGVHARSLLPGGSRAMKKCPYNDNHFSATDPCGLCEIDDLKREDGKYDQAREEHFHFPTPTVASGANKSKLQKIRNRSKRLYWRLKKSFSNLAKLKLNRTSIILASSFAAIIVFTVIATVVLYNNWGSSELSGYKLKGNIASVSPSAMRSNVSPDATITMKFTEPVDLDQSTKPYLYIKNGLNDVSGNATIIDDTLTFKPDAPLQSGTEVVIKLGNIIGAKSGLKLRMDKRWSFFTRPKLAPITVTRLARINHTKNQARFGQSLAVSPDGTKLFVGAPQDSERKFINGGSGSTSVFKLANKRKQWLQSAKFAPIMDSFKIDHLKEFYKYDKKYPLPYMKIDFGSSLAYEPLSRVLAVGAPAFKNRAAYTGKVFLYKEINGEWRNFALINNPNRTHNLFGIQVVFSGDGKTLAIASANSATDNVFSDAAIHIYKKRKKNWVHEHSIASADFYDFSEIDPTSPIKFALSYSGNKIAVAQKGKIAIFVPNVNKQRKRKRKRRRKVIRQKWILAHTLNALDPSPGSLFAVDLKFAKNGLLLVSETPLNVVTDPNATSQENRSLGAIYIFSKIDKHWEPIQKLVPYGGKIRHFGQKIDVSSDGNIILVGAMESRGISHQWNIFYLFMKQDGQWHSSKKVIIQEEPERYLATETVSLKLVKPENKRLIIFAGTYNDNNPEKKLAEEPGAVHIFEAEIKN